MVDRPSADLTPALRQNPVICVAWTDLPNARTCRRAGYVLQRLSLRAGLQPAIRVAICVRTVGRSFLANLVLLIQNVPPAVGALRHEEPRVDPNFAVPLLIHL
jgi:hypothetical protein